MPQGFKVAIGFQSYDLTRIANVRVADMVLAEAAFPSKELKEPCLFSYKSLLINSLSFEPTSPSLTPCGLFYEGLT